LNQRSRLGKAHAAATTRLLPEIDGFIVGGNRGGKDEERGGKVMDYN